MEKEGEEEEMVEGEEEEVEGEKEWERRGRRRR